jgi:SnoaL-like domain
MTDYNELVERYLAVWNEPDADARAKGIAGLWSEDGGYTDPLATVTGHEGIGAVVAGARDMFPGFVFRPHGRVDGHHDVARFGWELVPAAGGESVVVGFDVAVIAPDGRLRAVYGFLDKVPAG